MLSIPKSIAFSLCVVAVTKIQPSTCLSLRNRHSRPSTRYTGSRIQQWDDIRRRTRLQSRKYNDGDNESSRINGDDNKPTTTTTPLSPEASLLLDPGLWISDFLSLILASQLIGLLNILNSPEFIANGGWFQPIPAVPSTLDELVQRISMFGVAWAMASASVFFVARTTSTEALEQSSSEESDTSIILKKNVQTLAVFGVLLLIGNGIVFGLGDSNGNIDGQSGIHLLDALRNCYYVGLSTSGLRFLYGRYFLLS